MGRVLPPDDRRRQVPQPALARAAPGWTTRTADLRGHERRPAQVFTTWGRARFPVGSHRTVSALDHASGRRRASAGARAPRPRGFGFLVAGRPVPARHRSKRRATVRRRRPRGSARAPNSRSHLAPGRLWAPRPVPQRLGCSAWRREASTPDVPLLRGCGSGVGGQPRRVSCRSAGRGGSDGVPAAAQDLGARRQRAAGPAAARPRLDAGRFARRPNRARRLRQG